MFVYELVTEFCYPQSGAIAVGVTHLIAKPCILALTVLSDQVYDAYSSDFSTNTLFNDVIQFIFIGILAICIPIVAKYELKTPRLEVDE